MNRFTKRQKKIIKEISSSNDYITGKSLSLILNVSLRTIQSEVAEINKVLPLILSTNRGYSLDYNMYKALTFQLSEDEQNLEHIILKKVFFHTPHYNIDDLSDSLYISTTTLEKYFKTINKTLENFDLKISRNNNTVFVVGNELNKRKYLNKIIFDEINPAFNSIDNLTNYFEGIDVDKIKIIILNSINKYDYYIDNAYYNNLIVNITIALYRMRTDHYVSQPINNISDHSDNIESKIANEICTQYSAHCNIAPTKDDIFYISSLLEGIIKPINQNHLISSKDILSEDFIEDIREILLNVFSYYMLEINFDEYLYSFALHIHGLIKRANSIQSSGNDFLYNIKKNCPFIYDVSVNIAQKLNKKYNIHIADSEIGYISIHIGYLIESSNTDSDKVSILLLCHDYHHIDSNIEKKLLDNYDNFITLKLFNTNNSSTLIDAYSDLIITTQPLNLIGKEVIVVSPFFTMMDQINIDNAIHKCLENKQKIKRNNMLSSFFDKKLFFKSNNFSNKEDVIKFLGQNVIDYGLCKDGFIESVLEREQLSSTCFFDTFAIPHALDMNATHTMICVLTSENGIKWDEHTIHIVLMLAVQQNDRKKFMELYNGIVQTLEKPEKVNKLVSADSLMFFLEQLLEK